MSIDSSSPRSTHAAQTVDTSAPSVTADASAPSIFAGAEVAPVQAARAASSVPNAAATSDAAGHLERAAAAADSAAAISDPVFVEEQNHLSRTHAALKDLEAALLAKIAKTHAAVAADKEAMAGEFGVNLETDDDASETYADIAAANRIIDMYNLTEDINVRRLADARLLLTQPYFAKVVLQFKEGESPKEIYIGAAGASDEHYRRLVVDWRSPVAETYYNQDLGPTSYHANGRQIRVDMQLRRQFDIEGATLNAYFDTDVAIQDSLLLASLSRQRDGHMQAITATIQKEQNLVVRHEDVPVLLVSGIAGSGKTSVLLQRIAYLFYRRRDDLDPREVVLVTPNPVFRRYIDTVLPDMGEQNPRTITWNEFAAQCLPKGLGGSLDVPLDDLLELERRIDEVKLEPRDFKDIESDGVVLISAAQVARVAALFPRVPAGPRLAALMREELEERLTARIKQLAATEATQAEILDLPTATQVQIFGEPIAPQTDTEARALALTYLMQRHADAFAAVQADEWLRIDRIGMRLTGATSLTPVSWLFLKMALTNMGEPSVKYVMVDEVQDYTCAQLAVLARYFRRAHFLLLGDENQAIKERTASFAEVRATFEALRGPVDECRLMTSYRSAPAITALFTRLMPPDDRVHVRSIQRDDKSPKILACPHEKAWRAAVCEAVDEARGREDLTAIIAPWKQEAAKLVELLNGAVPLVDGAHAIPETGAFVITLPLAKGLEFDHVIIPDASARVYNGSDLARRRLYTAVSRATRQVTILANGPLTPLLSEK